MHDQNNHSDGLSPQKAGILLTVVVLAAIGLATLGVLVNRSSDPLYDLDNQSTQTRSRVMEGQDLWKKKQPVEPDAESTPKPSAATTEPSTR